MKTKKFKRIIGAVTATILSLSAVGFSGELFKYDDNWYDLTVSAEGTMVGQVVKTPGRGSNTTMTFSGASASNPIYVRILNNDITLTSEEVTYSHTTDGSNDILNFAGTQIYKGDWAVPGGFRISGGSGTSSDRYIFTQINFHGESVEFSSVIQYDYINDVEVTAKTDSSITLTNTSGENKYIGDNESTVSNTIINNNSSITLDNLTSSSTIYVKNIPAKLHIYNGTTVESDINYNIGSELNISPDNIKKVEALVEMNEIPNDGWGQIAVGHGGGDSEKAFRLIDNTPGVKIYTLQGNGSDALDNIATYAIVQIKGEARLLAIKVEFTDTSTNTSSEITEGNWSIPEYTAPKAKTDLHENGQDQELVTADTTSGLTFEYSTDDKSTWKSSATGKEVGDYNVYYRVKKNNGAWFVSNYPIAVSIGKRPSSVAYNTIEQPPFTFHNYYDDYVEVYECDVNAEKVEIPSEVEGDSKTVPVTRIGENAFNSCKSLTEVKIPDSITEIGANAFWGCTALESLTIPATVTNINKTAFSHCTAFGTIYGYTGSAAEEFAKANGYTFIDLDAVEPATDNKPSAPTNVAISEDGTVTWDNADNAAQYKVFKKYGGTAYYSGWVTDTSYKFKNLPNQDYEIYVAAKNDYGTAWSEHLQVKVENKLGTVNSVTVKDGTISWNAAQGAVAYKVGKVVNGKTYYGSKTTDTSYTFKYVPKSDYKVFVVAFDKEGNKTWGTKVDVKVN